MTEDDLLDADYRPGRVSDHDRFDKVWWKSVRDEKGTRYVVAVRFWDFRQYGADHDGWDTETHFRLPHEVFFHVVRSLSGSDLPTIETFLAELWQRMGCDHVKRYDE